MIVLGALILNGCEKNEMVVEENETTIEEGECSRSLKGGSLAVGSLFQGGAIFYILQSGDPGYETGKTKGFIVSPNYCQYDTDFKWYNGTYTTTGATGIALGTGYSNTLTIYHSQGPGNYAARAVVDYIDPTGIWNDWHLGSKDELTKLSENKALLPSSYRTGPGAIGHVMWTSSEVSSTKAWCALLDSAPDPLFYEDPKSMTIAARPIREFSVDGVGCMACH